MKQLSYLKETTKQFELDVHSVALELRPTTLDDLGLEAALSSFAREWAKDTMNESKSFSIAAGC